MEAHSCTICDHTYNISSKRPLVLPCSHSFCQDCLQQLEEANDTRCPVCRKDRGSVRVANLPSCYQLIPVEGQAEKGGMERTSNQEVCVEHGDEYIIWCLTCDVPACKKCLKLKHRSCDYIFMEEKLFISSLKDKFLKYSALLLDNKNEQTSIRSLAEKVTLLQKEKLDYQEKVEAWQVEAEKILINFEDNCRASAGANTVLDLDGNDGSAVLDMLEKKIPALHSPLLVHIASAHQTSSEDVGAFVSALQSCIESRPGDGPSCYELKAGQTRDLSIKDAVAALRDGGDWVVSDATTLAAVQSVLQTTCFRPKKLEVFWGDVPNELIVGLQALSNCVKYWTLDCFYHFEKPSSETRASTSTKLSTFFQFDKWAALTQFSGHLDAVTVQKLPATIKSVGLVLRDHEDMAAVNALCGAAFGSGWHKGDRSCLKWRDWTDLNLSATKTFLPDYWKMTWGWYSLINGRWTPTSLSLSTALLALGVRFRLHLPQLAPGDRHWMRDLFRVMELNGRGFSNPVPLHLPYTYCDPDILLGVLRDSGQPWDVHLPPSLPQLVPREEVAQRYTKYSHSATWDLE